MLFVGFVAAMILAGCSSPNSINLDDHRAAIESMYEATSVARQNASSPAEMADAYVTNLAEDAVWMVPNAPPVRGRNAVRDWAKAFFAQYDLEADHVDMEPMTITSEIAVRQWTAMGRYIPLSGEEPVPFDQKFVDILRRKPDGSWEKWQHMWSSNNKEPSIWD
jgi:ketosteroid isomerase-like protein